MARAADDELAAVLLIDKGEVGDFAARLVVDDVLHQRAVVLLVGQLGAADAPVVIDRDGGHVGRSGKDGMADPAGNQPDNKKCEREGKTVHGTRAARLRAHG